MRQNRCIPPWMHELKYTSLIFMENDIGCAHRGAHELKYELKQIKNEK